MIWTALGKAIYWAIGAAQAAGEAVGAGQRLVRQVRKGIVPLDDDTDPSPLTYRDVQRQRAQQEAAISHKVPPRNR